MCNELDESNRAFSGGDAPEKEGKTIIDLGHLTTPLGPMFACASERGICLLEFTDRKKLDIQFDDLCKKLNAVILPGENEHLTHLQKELAEYFAGERQNFTVALDIVGTDFQKSVWEALQKIPYGEATSYKQQAETIGSPTAARAVASAIGRNRLAIVIPCHRVIGSHGQLAGYAAGVHRKKWLLDLEDPER